MRPAVTIRSQHPDIVVTALLGNDQLAPVFSTIGWSEVARPKRQSITAWAGRSPMRMNLPLVFDGFGDDESVEPKLAKIEDMWRPPNSRHAPPVVRVTGPGIPHMYKNNNWVIESVTFGTGELDVWRNVRTRQELTLVLLEHVSVKEIKERNIDPGSGKGSGYRTYTVKRGDTLQKIAARLLGDHKRWREIARINHIRDPKHLKVGSKLRIPRN